MEFSALTDVKTLLKNSSLFKLSLVLEDGFMRIGGRLKHAPLEHAEMNPLNLPRHSHISTLLICHQQVKHQGHHFTGGPSRSSGLWIIRCKSLIRSVVHKCITRWKLCGKSELQTMADLPTGSLSTSPPLTYMGLDIFGPLKINAQEVDILRASVT